MRRVGRDLIYLPEKSTTLETGSFEPITGIGFAEVIDPQWVRMTIDEPYNPLSTPRFFSVVEVHSRSSVGSAGRLTQVTADQKKDRKRALVLISRILKKSLLGQAKDFFIHLKVKLGHIAADLVVLLGKNPSRRDRERHHGHEDMHLG